MALHQVFGMESRTIWKDPRARDRRPLSGINRPLLAIPNRAGWLAASSDAMRSSGKPRS